MNTPSKVWFTPLKDKQSSETTALATLKLAEAAGLKALAGHGRLVGILQHVGEGRNIGHIKPAITRALAAKLTALKAKPFLTGSATLYKGRRSNAVDHMMQAYEHGFTPEAIGCPIIMSDGLRGGDRIAVKVPRAKHCRTAYLGSAVGMMDSLLVVSHPTGHIAAGFGATIKNVSMGLADRGGKMAMHFGGHPIFNAAKCTACGRCAQWCPVDAIVIGKKATLTQAKCIGCGQCLSMCAFDAIEFEWGTNSEVFQERLVEYCAAVKERIGERILYLNICQQFTPECDCFDLLQKPVCPDIGILASYDPVAIDKATIDLLNQAAGRDLVQEIGKRGYEALFAHAEKIGLGSRSYQLKTI
jgi:uncharacterized Fe-S center protein